MGLQQLNQTGYNYGWEQVSQYLIVKSVVSSIGQSFVSWISNSKYSKTVDHGSCCYRKCWPGNWCCGYGRKWVTTTYAYTVQSTYTVYTVPDGYTKVQNDDGDWGYWQPYTYTSYSTIDGENLVEVDFEEK